MGVGVGVGVGGPAEGGDDLVCAWAWFVFDFFWTLRDISLFVHTLNEFNLI